MKKVISLIVSRILLLKSELEVLDSLEEEVEEEEDAVAVIGIMREDQQEDVEGEMNGKVREEEDIGEVLDIEEEIITRDNGIGMIITVIIMIGGVDIQVIVEDYLTKTNKVQVWNIQSNTQTHSKILMIQTITKKIKMNPEL